MDRKDEEKFEYSYSAPTAEERREIEGIRRQYCPAQDTESAEHGASVPAMVGTTTTGFLT